MGKITKENGKGWTEEIPIALWVHRTTKSQVTKASLFSLVYGTEVVILIDLVSPTVKLIEISRVPKEAALEIVKEKCDNAASHKRLYWANIEASHEGQIKERRFQVEELVWKTAPHVREVAGAVTHKFSLKCEVPYIVEEAHQTGHYWLKD